MVKKLLCEVWRFHLKATVLKSYSEAWSGGYVGRQSAVERMARCGTRNTVSDVQHCGDARH